MSEFLFNPYLYKAKVIDVHDGDTVTLNIDLGFGVILQNQKLRFAGINAPELTGANATAGAASRDWLKAKLLGQDVIIESIKDRQEKYGRWLAKVFLPNNSEMSLNDELVKLGFAVKY